MSYVGVLLNLDTDLAEGAWCCLTVGGESYMVRVLKMAVVLLSVHLHPTSTASSISCSHDWPFHLFIPPPPHPVIILRKEQGAGVLLVSLVTDEPTWHQVPYYWSSPSTWEWRLPRALPAFCTQDVTQDLARRGRSPVSVKPLMALLLTSGLSLVLKLGTYRPCRLAVCSPTEVSWKISS